MTCPDPAPATQPNVPRILEELQKSRERIAELNRLIAQERERGKELYSQFISFQAQMEADLGLADQAPTRRRTAQANLAVSTGKIVSRSHREGKTVDEARQLAKRLVLKLARTKYGMNAVPESILEILEDQIERHYGRLD